MGTVGGRGDSRTMKTITFVTISMVVSLVATGVSADHGGLYTNTYQDGTVFNEAIKNGVNSLIFINQGGANQFTFDSPTEDLEFNDNTLDPSWSSTLVVDLGGTGSTLNYQIRAKADASAEGTETVAFTVSTSGTSTTIHNHTAIVQDAPGAPPTASSHDPMEFQITASQAQCNGDETSFAINMDDGPPDSMEADIIDSSTGTVLMEITTAQMLDVNQHAYFFNRTLPAGGYVVYAFQDPPGVIAPSRFDSTAFNVPLGTCIDTPFDDSGLAALIVARTNQTNSYVNSTSEAILENLTSVHVHIDSHFNMTDALIVNQFFQTNGYINTTRIQILDAINDLDFNIDCGNETGNCTFEAQTMIDLPGLTDQQVGAFLLFLTMLIISFFQRWLFVAIASVIGILEVFILGGIFGFEFTGLLLVIGIMMQIFVDHRDAMLEKRAKEEGGELGD